MKRRWLAMASGCALTRPAPSVRASPVRPVVAVASPRRVAVRHQPGRRQPGQLHQREQVPARNRHSATAGTLAWRSSATTTARNRAGLRPGQSATVVSGHVWRRVAPLAGALQGAAGTRIKSMKTVLNEWAAALLFLAGRRRCPEAFRLIEQRGHFRFRCWIIVPLSMPLRLFSATNNH